jgi:hypothetical protein
MAIRQFAFVDPNALKEIASKIKVLHEDLDSIKKKLNSGITELNNSGFKDVMFSNLQDVVSRSEIDMKNLLNFLKKFEEYVRSQEKIISNEYLNSQKIK